jgi:hypothetical protein
MKRLVEWVVCDNSAFSHDLVVSCGLFKQRNWVRGRSLIELPAELLIAGINTK